MGLPLCRNQQWIDLSISYTENVFRIVVILRLFPRWLQPFIALFVPHIWIVRQNLRHAQNLVVPILNERENLKRANKTYKKPNDLLQWMVDAASEGEGEPHKLAHRQLLVTLAAIHTTTMAVTHALFDLCERPDYIEQLHKEIVQVLKEDRYWQKATPNKLQKLDSFMKESQRFSPPSLRKIILSPHKSAFD